MGRWTDRLIPSARTWLLEKACPPIRYRLLSEVEHRPEADPDVRQARQDVYAYKPAQTIANARSDDGTWFQSLLHFEPMNLPRKRGPGTLFQYHALVEYGWDRDHPIVWSTAKLLQGLLWEDPTMDLRELNGWLGGDPKVEVWLRAELARRALALLLRSGFQEDAGVRRKAAAYLESVRAFWTAPDVDGRLFVGETERNVGTEDEPELQTLRLIDPEAPVPDRHLLMIFGFDPELRERGREALEAICDWMFRNPPVPSGIEIGGKLFEREEALSIRGLDRADFERDKLVGRLLQDLELLARCGVLERSPRAVELLAWLTSLQDEEGVVRADEVIEKVVNPTDYPYFPLEDNWRGKHKKFTDTTFRLHLIAAILDQREAETARV